MKVGVLTSSRADFGIYLPLLKLLKRDPYFDLKIIAFGTHLSPFHGMTKNQIIANGFEVDHEVESMLLSDSSDAVSTAMGLTISKFASFWKSEGRNFDLVFCLGDRYEMLAAVFAGVPFQIPFAHLHGGEKTLGAIDNVFRHSLTHAAKLHFTSTESHRRRTEQLLDVPKDTYNVGALSLDNIKELDLLTVDEFKKKWNVDFKQPTVLVTFHPETVKADKNEEYANTLVDIIRSKAEVHFLITMPNADTAGSIIRNIFADNLEQEKNVTMVENLGVQSYFSAMNHCRFLMGNTSSGIIEAASFKKFVINLGNRQEGRSAGENVIQVPIVEKEIAIAVDRILKTSLFAGDNIYHQGGAGEKIIEILKKYDIQQLSHN